MKTRVFGWALMLSALSFLGASKEAAANGDECLSRECRFQIRIPPFLQVGDCVQRDSFAFIPVYTNTRTQVCIRWTDFTRRERSCDGSLLKTTDAIGADLAQVVFKDFKECDPSDPDASLESTIDSKGKNEICWCVSSHRGGYTIGLALTPDCADPCDDAGCYEARVCVTVCLKPFDENCETEPTPPAPPIKEKGNNGVGNGLDPQPPGNPPINDGPGTSPGDPGNQGGH